MNIKTRFFLLGLVAFTFLCTVSYKTTAQNFDWAVSMGDINSDFGRSITTDAIGNVYTTGYFQGLVDFDPGPGLTYLNSAVGSYDIFIQKLDISGNLLWARSMGGINEDQGTSIVVDAVGNVHTTGWFQNTVDFDPGPGVFNLTSMPGSHDIFIQKLDASGNFLWAKSMGGINDDYGFSIALDANGNVYTTGWFRNKVDFDPGIAAADTFNLTSAGDQDIFIQKLDASGNFLWAVSMGSGSQDYSRSITIDVGGNVYTTGQFGGTVDFDPDTSGVYNLTSISGSHDIFIQKLDSSGNLLWAKSMGSIAGDYGYSIDVDASGNTYTTGYFEGTVDFNPGVGTYNLTSGGGHAIFILKLDVFGNFLWAISMTGEGYSIAVDASGNAYTTGVYGDTVDFDPGVGVYNLTSKGNRDIFIQKLDSFGNFLWATSVGNTNQDEVRAIAVDVIGNVYTTGGFLGTVDFDPDTAAADTFNLTSAGNFDIFIQKLTQCVPTSSSTTVTACSNYTVPSGDETYTSSGTYTDTIPNMAGCDSVITINLTVTNPSQNLIWARSMGGTNGEQGHSIAVDDSGNVYTTGYFQGTTDFDPGVGIVNLSSNGGADIFVQKLDAAGNLIWVKSIGSAGSEESYSIAVDASGNVYTTGYFSGTADFDPGPGVVNLTSAGSIDIFIQKLDGSGNLLWARSMGSTNNDRGRAIAVDGSGNVYTTGWFQGTADFDPGVGIFNLISAGTTDIFIQKLDTSGNLLWAKSVGNIGGEAGWGIAVDASGNVYATGYFDGTVDFDPGFGVYNLTSAGSQDIFIQKLDALGNLVWARGMGGTSDDWGFSTKVDANGNVFTTGWMRGTADFDPGVGVYNLTAVGIRDIFIQKLDISGNLVWAKSMGGTGEDDGRSITVDAGGNVYTTGRFVGTVDFNPGPGVYNLTSAGSQDIFIQKLNTSGNLVWANSVGSTGGDWGFSVAVDASGNVHTTGLFTSTVDFDPGVGIYNLTSVGNSDIFIQKLGQPMPTSSTIAPTPCDSYTVPSDDETYTTSGTYMDTIPNTVGCDSIITINLTVNSTTTATISPTACNSYTVPSGDETYMSGGTYNDTIPNTAGCDSIITINLIINSTTTATISPTACNSYTVPSGDETYMSGGTYNDTIPNTAGCDSIITINLTVNSTTTVTISPTACNSYTVPSGDETYMSGGTYSDTIPNTAGCDSIITINLTVNSTTTATISPTACNSYTVPSGDETYMSDGTYNDTIPNTSGCDSIITINLTVNSTTTATISPTTCNSYTVPSGDETYMSGGTYSDTIPNTSGCDSIITINLTVNGTTTATIITSVCGSYTVPSGDETYTATGTYVDTIPNTAGCDSIITINLTVSSATASTINQTACNSYTVPSGDETYTISGTYADTIPNTAGCDSIITIILTINNGSISTISPIACNSYTVPSGDETYTVSGTYSDTIPNAAGCDSIITINLTIDPTVPQTGNIIGQTVVTPLSQEQYVVSQTIGSSYNWMITGGAIVSGQGTNIVQIQWGSAGTGLVSVVETNSVGCAGNTVTLQVQIIIVGISEYDAGGGMLIYPNPFTETTTITFSNEGAEPYLLIAYDLLGNRVRIAENITSGEFVIEKGDLTAGVYLIELRGVTNTYRGRMIVE